MLERLLAIDQRVFPVRVHHVPGEPARGEVLELAGGDDGLFEER